MESSTARYKSNSPAVGADRRSSIASWPMAKRRPLTSEEKEDADRLARLWGDFKLRHPDVSQEQMSLRCGWSASAFDQYKSGRIPLNTDAVITVCRVLGVQISDLSPRIATRIASVSLGQADPESPIDRNVLSEVISFAENNFSKKVSPDERTNWIAEAYFLRKRDPLVPLQSLLRLARGGK